MDDVEDVPAGSGGKTPIFGDEGRKDTDEVSERSIAMDISSGEETTNTPGVSEGSAPMDISSSDDEFHNAEDLAQASEEHDGSSGNKHSEAADDKHDNATGDHHDQSSTIPAQPANATLPFPRRGPLRGRPSPPCPE